MSQLEFPTEEDFNAWRRHPVTEFLFLWAFKKREGLKEDWASGAFSDPSFELAMAIKNAGATGACSILKDLLDLDYESAMTEITDGEYKRVSSTRSGSSGSTV